MSGAEKALERAILAVLAADAGVRGVLGDPLRVLDVDSPQPAYPYLEIARHQSAPAGAAAVDASEHRVDLVALSRNDGGEASSAAVAAIRGALTGSQLAIEGWRCVLVVPVFADLLRQGQGVWRGILRIRAVVEEI